MYSRMQVIIGRVLPYTRLLLIISKELVWYADVLVQINCI